MDATLQVRQAIIAQCPKCDSVELTMMSQGVAEPAQFAEDDRPRITTSYECERCGAAFIEAR